jgi:hypothetical protein
LAELAPDDALAVAGVGKMIGAGQFNVFCAGDVFGEVSRVIDRYHRVAAPV